MEPTAALNLATVDWATLLAGLTPILALLGGSAVKALVPKIPRALIPLLVALLGGILGELNGLGAIAGTGAGFAGVGLHGFFRRVSKDVHEGKVTKVNEPG